MSQPKSHPQSFLIQSSPTDIPTGLAALARVEKALQQKTSIKQAFFYGAAVSYASQALTFPSGAPHLQNKWLELACTYNFPLIVCATQCEYYGLTAKHAPEGSLHPDFQMGGLTEFISLLSESDTLWQFQQTLRVSSLNSELQSIGLTQSEILKAHPISLNQTQIKQARKSGFAFIMTASAENALAREALDLLLNAASLDIPVQVFYSPQALSQLAQPHLDMDLFKKVHLLTDIYELEPFHTTVTALELAEQSLETLRVPVTILTEQEIKQRIQSSQHLLLF